MHKAGTFVVCAGLLALLLPRPAAAAWPTDPKNVNVPLCTATGNQFSPAITSDGEGGAIVTWQDYRSDNGGIYSQRISAAGAVQWTADGAALCTATNASNPTIDSDGEGGAIVTWQDYRNGNYDIYAQRISASGAVQWTANGVALCTAAGEQQVPAIVSDGAGGAIVSWSDHRSGNSDIYAQKLSAAGAVQWAADGVALCTATGTQGYQTIVSDGAGGAIVSWSDYRNGNSDIYAQKILAAGAVQWAADGVALSTATGDQQSPTIISDGAGGAIVTWQDLRNDDGRLSNYDIYAQRISTTGAVQWTANGEALCTDAVNQFSPTITSDGEGGAFVAWEDYRNGNGDIYSQRISAAGAVRWTANGVTLCTATGFQGSPSIISDGGAPSEAGSGAIATWQDTRSGNSDIYAQKISAAGAVQWAADGVALSTATGEQGEPTIAADGAGGAIVAWNDYRSGTNNDIYAQRIGSDGYFVGFAPSIISVTDVPADQGGKVRIKWKASCLDSLTTLGISVYGVWRRVEESTALKAVAGGARLNASTDGSAETQPRTFRTTASGAGTLYWEGVGTVAARGYPTYTFTTWTFEDSTVAGNPYSVFMVDAHASWWPEYWSSFPDSGYSVDNLVPPTPAPFTGQYASGTATLHWAVNPAADLDEYRLYRGSTADFVPGPGNLVVAQSDTGYVDAAGAPFYYKLSAVDVHGNASGFSTLLPSGTADVPADASLEFALEGVRPNPSHGERLSVAFTLPAAAPGKLELVDVSGRRVAEREVGSLGAGRHTLDLVAGRRLPPGLYLVRLTQGANTRVTRVAVLR
jgi:hypothetical protein